nr:hypothetical protein [Actinoplanes derwentensis]GID89629.1 hypothetical protein Ade03nite_85530 [Actinoplanes derwentensis]
MRARGARLDELRPARAPDVNEALARLKRNDVRYRFVLDLSRTT